MMSLVVRTVTKTLYPFMILFGIYVIIHGHLTPGGGFPGGVILASAVIILTLAFGITRKKEEKEIDWAETLESDALLTILGVFLFTILITKVLPRFEIFTGPPGTLFSGGPIPLLNLGVGVEVVAALTIIFFSMIMMKEAGK